MSWTPTLAAPPLSKRKPTAALHRFGWVVLGYNVLVVLWGAVVRATRSGAGCGDHWPLCNGVVLQSHPRLATLIELAHRLSSGLTLPLVLLLVVWTFRSTVRGHVARWAAVAATVLTLNEAVLGALLVLLGLTAENRSPARAVYLSLHLVNTLLLLGALALSAYSLTRGPGFQARAIYFTQLPLALTGLAATLLVGASGTLAALSDTLFPATSLRAALMQDLSTTGSWLIRVRIVHPAAAVVAGVFVVWLVVRGLRRPAERALAFALVLLLGLQFGLGLADVALLAPVWMQIVHLLGADLMWIVMVLLTVRICVTERLQAT